MKFEIEIPYDNIQVVTLLRKYFSNKKNSGATKLIERLVIETLDTLDSGKRFKHAKSQIEATGWTLIIDPGLDAWKVRKEDSKLLYYPVQELLKNTLDHTNIYGLDSVLAYLKTLKPYVKARAKDCSTCKYFKDPESNSVYCKKNQRMAVRNGEYSRFCDIYKPKKD
jgi:hypothetical protein